METKTLRYIVEFDAQYADKMDRALALVGRRAESVEGSLKQVSAASQTTGLSFVNLAKRAILVIPTWLALRSVFMGFITTIRDGLQHIVELDKAMARVAAVTQDVGDKAKFLSELRNEIRKLSGETGESVDKIAEAFYKFGEAGHSAKVSTEGMRISLKTAIATMDDSGEIARMISDTYNLMKDNITGATTVQEKMNTIGSTMAVLWKYNAYELNEFTAGMKTWVGIAKNFNLSFDETVALLAAGHTLMQRGGTGGTQLARTFSMMAANIKQVNLQLGRVVNLKVERVFDVYIELLKKVNSQYGDSAMKMKVLNDIFGKKGVQVTAAFSANLKLVLGELERLKNMPLAERMKVLNELFELQIDTLDRQIKRFNEMKQIALEMFVIGITGAQDFKGALKEVNEVMKNTIIPTMLGLGIVFRRTFKSMGDILTAFKQIGDAVAQGDLTKAKSILGGELFTGPEQQRRNVMFEKARTKGGVGSYISAPGSPSGQVEEFQKKFGEPYEQARATNDVVKQMNILVNLLGFAEDEAKGLLSPMEETYYELIKMNEGVKSFQELMEKTKGTTTEETKNISRMAALMAMFPQTLEARLENTKLLETLGFSQIDIEKERLRLMIDQDDQLKNQQEILTQYLKVQQTINEEIITFSNTLQSAVSSALADVFKGKATVKEGLSSIAEKWANSFADTLSTRLVDIMAATGIFQGGGKALAGLAGSLGGVQSQISIALQTGGLELNTQITSALSTGGDQLAAKIQGAIAGTGGGTTGGTAGTPAAAGGGWMQGAMKYGMAGVMGGMAGYQRGGVAGGIMGGLGGMMSMSGNPYLQAAGMGLSMLSMLFGKKTKETTTETQTQVNQVASKIDVSNKQLQNVNRNLIALRATFETYIMPNSAYFSAKRNIDDEFSINARR